MGAQWRFICRYVGFKPRSVTFMATRALVEALTLEALIAPGEMRSCVEEIMTCG